MGKRFPLAAPDGLNRVTRNLMALMGFFGIVPFVGSLVEGRALGMLIALLLPTISLSIWLEFRRRLRSHLELNDQGVRLIGPQGERWGFAWDRLREVYLVRSGERGGGTHLVFHGRDFTSRHVAFTSYTFGEIPNGGHLLGLLHARGFEFSHAPLESSPFSLSRSE